MLESENKQLDLYELLDAIEARPGLYLGSMSVRLLKAFIDGVLFASARRDRFPLHSIDFHNWVALRLGFFESTSGYANMILKSEGGDEERSFDRLFELWREFRYRQSRVMYEAERGGEPNVVSQRRLDSGAIEEMRSDIVQIIKYTDDDSGFIKYVDGDKEIVEFYVHEFGEIFWGVDALGFKLPKSEWRKVSD